MLSEQKLEGAGDGRMGDTPQTVMSTEAPAVLKMWEPRGVHTYSLKLF